MTVVRAGDQRSGRVEVKPRSSHDTLGNAFARMVDEPREEWTPQTMLHFIELDRYRGGHCTGRAGQGPSQSNGMCLAELSV